MLCCGITEKNVGKIINFPKKKKSIKAAAKAKT